MANVDNPRGFHPENVSGCRPPRRYPITGDYATALFTGDPVTLTSGYIVKATAGTDNSLLGFISHFECADGIQTQAYYPADSALTWYAFVYDDPATRFVAQDDGDTTQISLAMCGTLGNLILTHSGNTSTGLSGAELDASSFNSSTVTDQLRLIALVDKPGNAVGANAEWIVEIHNHFYRQENNVDAI
jgi:hypothetical protein